MLDSDPVGRDPDPVTFSGDPADQISATRPSVKPELGQESTPADALPLHVDSRSSSAQLDEHFIATVVERTLQLNENVVNKSRFLHDSVCWSFLDSKQQKFSHQGGR